MRRETRLHTFFIWSVVSGPDFGTRLINLSVSRIADLPLTLTSSWTLRLFPRRFLGTIRSFSVPSAIKEYRLKPALLLENLPNTKFVSRHCIQIGRDLQR